MELNRIRVGWGGVGIGDRGVQRVTLPSVVVSPSRRQEQRKGLLSWKCSNSCAASVCIDIAPRRSGQVLASKKNTRTWQLPAPLQKKKFSTTTLFRKSLSKYSAFRYKPDGLSKKKHPPPQPLTCKMRSICWASPGSRNASKNIRKDVSSPCPLKSNVSTKASKT